MELRAERKGATWRPFCLKQRTQCNFSFPWLLFSTYSRVSRSCTRHGNFSTFRSNVLAPYSVRLNQLKWMLQVKWCKKICLHTVRSITAFLPPPHLWVAEHCQTVTCNATLHCTVSLQHQTEAVQSSCGWKQNVPPKRRNVNHCRCSNPKSNRHLVQSMIISTNKHTQYHYRLLHVPAPEVAQERTQQSGVRYDIWTAVNITEHPAVRTKFHQRYWHCVCHISEQFQPGPVQYLFTQRTDRWVHSGPSWVLIQSVPGGMCQTSVECSLR